MLTRFATKNFRGFAEKIEWNLSRPSNYEFNQFAIKNGIVKNGIIYGPNGSGKSNFGFAIFDIVNHLTQKHKDSEYYNNFSNAGNIEMPVDFEYEFQFDDNKLIYSYSKNRNGGLLTEQIEFNNTIVLKRNGLEIDLKGFSINKNALNNFIQNNANQISFVNYLLASVPLSTEHYLIKLQNFVNSMLWFRNLEDRGYIGLQTGTTVLQEYIIQNNLINDFATFLKEVSGQSFVFMPPQDGDKKIMCMYGGNIIPFSSIRSTGTSALTLLYYWFHNMNTASFVFIDEFDAFYHYALSAEICKRLFKLDNCQVFMTSHNTYLMTNDLLRPDCNFILQDNKIKPLCDCTEKELRFGHNIEKIYKAGAFHV